MASSELEREGELHDDGADVPYGEDFHVPEVARAWAEAAGQKRPWRAQFFDRFVAELLALPVAPQRILELGSGPGFLAEQILRRVPSVVSYTLLDFSEPMSSLARERLSGFESKIVFVRADFKLDDWRARVSDPFDVVVSMQAVHELRHKRHAQALYREALSVLVDRGVLLVCDHLPGSDPSTKRAPLYMTETEHVNALSQAGFSDVTVRFAERQMALYLARAQSQPT